MQPQQKQKKSQQQQQGGGGYSQLMSGFSQQQLHQEDSMQCSEVMTVNQTNGLITSNNNHNLSANSDQQINHNHNNHKNLGIDRKDHEKKTLQALQKEFDIMQFNYANEDYSFQINRLCKRISSEKHAQDIACKFPLYKMIRSIVKKFLLNELELLFFGYVLEESKWKVDDIEVRKHAYYMNDFLNITEVKDVLDYKAVLLYLILTAYGVKFYLNEEADMVVFSAHMNTIVKDFATLFQYWSKNYGSTSFKIVPKSLNRVYRNLMKKPTDSNKRQHEDYNALVDAIIQISPPYNNEKMTTVVTAGNSSSNNNNNNNNNNNPSELGESTVKQVKLENGSTRIMTGNGNTKMQSISGSKTTGSANNQSNYVSQHNQLLKKIVEKKQQQQLQEQGQHSPKAFSNQNQATIQQGGVTGTIGYQQQYQQQYGEQQQYPQSSTHTFNQHQPQQQILESQRIDFSGDFGGMNNNGSIHLPNNNPTNTIPSAISRNHNPNSLARTGSNKNPHLQPNNNNNIDTSSSHTGQLLKRENSLLQGLTGTNVFNTDQLDFLNNNININRPSSNNNFNFNHSYSSLALGGGYPSFLHTIPQQGNSNLTNINNDIAKSGNNTTILNQLTNNLDTNNINIINNNNFGMQLSGSFDNPMGTTAAAAGVIGNNNPLGAFNTTTAMAFSNGFIGQNHNNINININNSFTSNQAGFNNNNTNLYSQFQGSSAGQHQPSLHNLLFQTHQKKKKNKHNWSKVEE